MEHAGTVGRVQGTGKSGLTLSGMPPRHWGCDVAVALEIECIALGESIRIPGSNIMFHCSTLKAVEKRFLREKNKKNFIQTLFAMSSTCPSRPPHGASIFFIKFS